MPKFNVYVIHSSKPITELKEYLSKCGQCFYTGIIYKSISTRGEKIETKKTIIFCPEETIEKFKETYPTFESYVANYDWSSFPVPNESYNETWNLHISGVPNDYTSSDAEQFVINSLKWMLPPVDDKGVVNYTVEFTPRSRETGEIYGYGKIKFESHVDHYFIKLCKLILHNTPLKFKRNSMKKMVTCIWQKTSRDTTKSWISSKHKNYHHFDLSNKYHVQVIDVTNVPHSFRVKTNDL